MRIGALIAYIDRWSVRAGGHMVYFETTNGGAVFSVGSITFCGSLPWNNFDNQILVLLRNVGTQFMAE